MPKRPNGALLRKPLSVAWKGGDALLTESEDGRRGSRKTPLLRYARTEPRQRLKTTVPGVATAQHSKR
jgi:hypothetical protein